MELGGELTSQGFDLYNDLRGKTLACDLSFAKIS